MTNTKHTEKCLKAQNELDNAPMMSGSSICVCKKHTPTPWNYARNEDGTFTIESDHLDHIGIIFNESDAKLIDRSVNEYERMKGEVEALINERTNAEKVLLKMKISLSELLEITKITLGVLQGSGEFQQGPLGRHHGLQSLVKMAISKAEEI